MAKQWFLGSKLRSETPVGTSRQVLAGSRVMTVVHQNDGTWQFLSDSPMLPSDWRVVHFYDIVALDSAVRQFVRLPKGMVAVVDAGGEWRRLYFETDTEIDAFFGSIDPSEQS